MKKTTLPATWIILTITMVMFCCHTVTGQTHPLISSVTSPCFETYCPPANVWDGNLSTYYLVHPYVICSGHTNIELNMELKKTVKALKVTITAGVSGINVSPGNALNYHKTLSSTETLYIIKPDGFSNIQFAKSDYGQVYEIEVEEIDLNAVTLPFEYDAAGNMTKRTILLASTKSAMAAAPPSTEWDTPEKEQTNWEELHFGEITIYPNPTRGELRIETDFDDVALTGATLSVYSVNGARILHQPFLSSSPTISIADQPSGMYILTLTANGKTHRWNIIKE